MWALNYMFTANVLIGASLMFTYHVLCAICVFLRCEQQLICYMLQFTSIQSRRRGQGLHREDWPTVIKEEQGFALNIGIADVNVIKGTKHN